MDLTSTTSSAGEGIGYPLQYSWVSLVTQLVKNLPAKQETWVRSLGLEDPLEKGKLWDNKESDMTERLSFSLVPKQNNHEFFFYGLMNVTYLDYIRVGLELSRTKL